MGEKYLLTRHNVGFMAIDAIAENYGKRSFTNKFHASFMQIEDGTCKILLLKPTTYMNNSGVSVSECANFYKIPLNDIIVFHDDLDLELGKIKIKHGGGNGGHNGLKSIDHLLGNDYNRLRFGIGKPLYKSAVSDYVLQNFLSTEMEIIIKSLRFLAEHMRLLLKKDFEGFLNKYALMKNNEEKKIDGI